VLAVLLAVHRLPPTEQTLFFLQSQLLAAARVLSIPLIPEELVVQVAAVVAPEAPE
jgi:hypothetical protein